jgi:hypothetical protein
MATPAKRLLLWMLFATALLVASRYASLPSHVNASNNQSSNLSVQPDTSRFKLPTYTDTNGSDIAAWHTTSVIWPRAEDRGQSPGN